MRQTVIIKQRGMERARAGHLWIYRSDVARAEAVAGGSVVSVRDERGRFVGQALYSSRSEISLRLLTLTDEEIDREWWRERLRASAQRREGIKSEANAYRLIYSEGDLLPSLIVDVYDDVLVLQTLSQGTDALKEMFVELLVEEHQPRAIIERNDMRVRHAQEIDDDYAK